MARRDVRDFECKIVREKVRIYLRVRRQRRFEARSLETRFVQCNQGECQYVDKNTLPCPLDADVFVYGKARRADGECLCRW